MKQSNAKRLFPNEPRNNRGEFGAFSKRFNRYKKSLGIQTDQNNKLDFHSFRHNLHEALYANSIDDGVVDAITGHKDQKQSEGRRSYNQNPFPLKTLYEALLTLKYPVNLDAIKPNGWLAPKPNSTGRRQSRRS